MFIYVFKESDRDILTDAGYTRVCEDEKQKMWVFLLDTDRCLPDLTEYITTDKVWFQEGIENGTEDSNPF